jgi:glucan biosynthesis protein C
VAFRRWKKTKIKVTKMKGGRIFFIDNLRILLVILVILFHVAITYGAVGSWYYHEEPTDQFTFFLLSTFVATTQSFFMGFYFLISGYFTPSSYNRKHTRVFLKDRLVRLGIPLLIYTIIIDPAIVYLLAVSTSGVSMSFLEYYGLRISRLNILDLGSSFGVGPLWFVEALLIFAFFYAFYRLRYKPSNNNLSREERQPANRNKVPDNRRIVFFVLLLSGVTFIARLVFPIGEDFLFLQLGFFPQYISLFILGIVASQRKWFQNLSVSKGKLWLTIAIIGIFLLPIIWAFGGEGFASRALGGLNYESFVYAVWESFVGVGMILGLLVLFHTKFNNQGELAKAMSADAYTVYIIFAPIIVVLSLAMANISLYPLTKFALVSFAAVPLCFAISHYIRKIRLVKNIL